MYKHLVIPTDGSELSESAVRQGIAFAKSIDTKVTVVTVFPLFRMIGAEPMSIADLPERYRAECRALGERYLRVGRDAARIAGVACDAVEVERDDPFRAIIDTAAGQGCDLIFMASHGRRGLAALVLSSETTKALTRATIPVLVCR